MLTILRRFAAGLAWPVIAAVVVADLFVFGLVAVTLQASYTQHLERAAIAARNTNRLVAQSIAGEIDRIDMGLRAVQDEYGRQVSSGRLDRAGLAASLGRQHERLPMIDSVRIADRRGDVVLGSDAQLPGGISIADRDYFLALRDGATPGLAISKPVLGRISGKWVLILARALRRADDGFDGIVYAAVTIDWFNQKFAKLEVGPNGAVVLRGNASRDFDLLARYPQAGFVGQTKVSPQFTAMIGAQPQGGTYEANAGADNVRRTFSYQAVGDYPLITLVGLGTTDTLAAWWREVAKLLSAAAAFALVTALGGWAVLRAWNARAQAYRTVSALNAELAADNDARRQAEAEVARLNAELEQKVFERTAQLEAAIEELEAFSYSISHDLRAPLRAIDGFAHVLTDDYAAKLDAPGRQCLETIRRNAHRMGTLIDDILEFARMSRSAMALAPLDMTTLAQEVFDEVRAAVPERTVALHLGALPPALGEHAMIRQVLTNLLSNAVKFTAPRAAAIVEVTGSAAAAENTYCVKDNGVGFDMQYANKLFGVFERLHGVKEFEGTGIGLAIVKRIVERHGGRVWAESAVNAGTSIYFTLPRDPAPVADPERKIAS